MFLSASIKNKEREIEKDVPIEAGNTGNHEVNILQ